MSTSHKHKFGDQFSRRRNNFATSAGESLMCELEQVSNPLWTLNFLKKLYDCDNKTYFRELLPQNNVSNT